MKIWEDISGLNGRYKISNYGDIKSMPRKIITNYGEYLTKEKNIKGTISKKGYLIFEASFGRKKENRYIKPFHRIVAETFIHNPLNKPHVNHIDGNKLNNCVDNLEWVTNQENMQHAFRTGLIKNKFGINAKHSKYTYSCKSLGIENMMANEIGLYFRDVLKITKSNKTVANNIRLRNRSFGYVFERSVI